MTRACLYCGGLGANKLYENRAGDYHWAHCVMCDGFGREIPERLAQLQREHDARLAAYEAKKAAAPWWSRWLL